MVILMRSSMWSEYNSYMYTPTNDDYYYYYRAARAANNCSAKIAFSAQIPAVSAPHFGPSDFHAGAPDSTRRPVADSPSPDRRAPVALAICAVPPPPWPIHIYTYTYLLLSFYMARPALVSLFVKLQFILLPFFFFPLHPSFFISFGPHYVLLSSPVPSPRVQVCNL